jgi:hypothetical protein
MGMDKLFGKGSRRTFCRISTLVSFPLTESILTIILRFP